MAQINFFDTKECEWSDGRLHIAGARVQKIKGFSFSIDQEKEPLYAEGDEPHSIQSGRRAYKGELKVLLGASEDMDTAAVAGGGRDKLDLEFDVVVTFKEKGARGRKTKTAVGVQATGYTIGWDEGAKEMVVSMPIVFLRWVG